MLQFFLYMSLFILTSKWACVVGHLDKKISNCFDQSLSYFITFKMCHHWAVLMHWMQSYSLSNMLRFFWNTRYKFAIHSKLSIISCMKMSQFDYTKHIAFWHLNWVFFLCSTNKLTVKVITVFVLNDSFSYFHIGSQFYSASPWPVRTCRWRYHFAGPTLTLCFINNTQKCTPAWRITKEWPFVLFCKFIFRFGIFIQRLIVCSKCSCAFHWYASVIGVSSCKLISGKTYNKLM